MKLKHKGLALTIVVLAITSMLVVYSLPSQSYLDAKRGARVDSWLYKLIKSPDAVKTALLTHEVDAAGVPRPEDIADLQAAGHTLTSMSQIGQTFMMSCNLRWPMGVPLANPDDPWFDEATAFRKALHRIIDMDTIVAQIYTDPGTGAQLMAKAERWLPPGQETWIAMGQSYEGGHVAPDIGVPPHDPIAAADLLDAAGFVEGTTPNPDYDPLWPGSATHMRIDPKTGNDLDFEYYVIGPVDSPLGFAMGELISSWFNKMGVGHTFVAGTWLGMVIRLINNIYDDFQLMTGIGIVWGSTAPDMLRDLTYSTDIPLWNFDSMNFTKARDHDFCTDHYDAELNMDIDYWGDKMIQTLDIGEVKHSCFEIQEALRDYEPYRPMLLWNNFAATTGEWTDPQGSHMGGIRIVNMAGQGIGQGWTRTRQYSGRTDPTLGDISKYVYGSDLCSQNPLEADCAVDWGTILGNVYEGLWSYTPYSRDYWYTGAEEPHVSEIWIGPGSSKRVSGNGVYDAAVTYDLDGNLLTYGGEAIADVTSDELQGDDQMGMVTTWKLREDLHWHDSDPGPDAMYGKASDGPGEPGYDDGAGPDDIVGTGDDQLHRVTTADVEFAARLMMGKTAASTYENVRYLNIWQHLAGYIAGDGPFTIEIVDDYTFKLYEERRFVFAFETHDILLLAPKHVWEPYVNGGGDPASWTGYEDMNKLDPVRQRLGMSDLWLTYQIGFGPYVYHYGNWVPGVSTQIDYNPLYFMGNCYPGPADVDIQVYYDGGLPPGLRFYGIVDAADYYRILSARDNNPGGWSGGTPDDVMWDPSADLTTPSQIVTGAEISTWYADRGESWGAGYPV